MVLAKLEVSIIVRRIRSWLTPVSWKTQGSSENTSSEERTGTPAHGHPRGKVTSHSHRTDLGSVGGSQGLEDTPWETTNHISDKEHG
jgi:hypothetical protein